MSPMLEKLRSYFEKGYWSRSMLEDAVAHGWLTEEELESIVSASPADVHERGRAE